MNDLKALNSLILEKISGNSFQKVTLSNPFKKSTAFFKIYVEPKRKSNEVFYQFSYFYDTRVKHENFYDPSQVSEKICYLLAENYKQCDIICNEDTTKVLMNKKAQYKIISGRTSHKPKEIQEHNIKKDYILIDGKYVDWLYKLGLSDKTGKILNDKQKKFRQINKFLEVISNIAGLLPQNPTIIDFGCGKSYLTFALYHYLRENNIQANIIGLDLKTDVVELCNRLAEDLGFDGMSFIRSDIKNYQCPGGKADMIITLHACDTATDYALYNAISWNCRVILSVPCCQHELFGQIKNDSLRPLLKHGILKERFSALLTDAIRSGVLELYGYNADVIEFIDMEHTPKNILIRAVKKENFTRSKNSDRELKALIENFGVSPTLCKLLEKSE